MPEMLVAYKHLVVLYPQILIALCVKEVIESWIGTRISWAQDPLDCMHLLPQILGGCIIIITTIH